MGCSKCKYFYPDRDHTQYDAEDSKNWDGQCRRYPPQVFRVAKNTSVASTKGFWNVYPRVKEYDWCGECRHVVVCGDKEEIAIH